MKIVKWVGIAFACLVLYGFCSALTYNLHEARFPGTSTTPAGVVFNGSKHVAFIWPIGLPVTLGILAAERIAP